MPSNEHPPVPRPDVEELMLEFDRGTLELLDAWIAKQPDTVTRSAAIKAIVQAGLQLISED